METTVSTNVDIEVKTILAIRRKPGLVGLPGDDPINYNFKVGSSMKGVDCLRGLNRQEEVKYLPSLINIFPSKRSAAIVPMCLIVEVQSESLVISVPKSSKKTTRRFGNSTPSNWIERSAKQG